jgi:alkylation response protein AidB-like acyl-CoA dehydrogenase
LRFLENERAALEKYLPGLDAKLAATPLSELESRDAPAIQMFRDAQGLGLLIPQEQRGHGASAVDAVRVQRAIGSRSPSLAVASTMHHFSAATMLELWTLERGLEWLLLQAVGEGKLMLASGFAEGVRGQGVLTPTMRGRREDGHVVISGTKKPCSLSRSMNLLTASVLVEREGGQGEEFAVALVPADKPGVIVEPFWGSPILAGAESDAVILEDVCVENELLIAVGGASPGELDRIETAGFLWFVLLISSSYLGMASALVERLIAEPRGEPGVALAAAVELETAMTALEGTAQTLTSEGASIELLAKALLCRYGAQDAINRAVTIAVELLGGMAFIGGEEVSYFASASRALAFHPPARAKNAELLLHALGGANLIIR